MTRHDAPPDAKVVWRIAAAFLGVYFLIVMVAVWRAPFPNNFDELAHLSYIVHIARFGVSDLSGDSMFLLRPDLSPGFSTNPNYLNHPPAFYLALSVLVPEDGWPTLQTVHLLRAVNAGLSTASVGCALAVAVLRRIEPRVFLLFGAMIVCAPVQRYIGGAINNDNLAVLGGCACVLGAQILSLHDRSCFGKAFLILGCTAATLAKLTAMLMTGIFTLVFLVARWRTEKSSPGLVFFAVLGGAEILAGAPYGWYFIHYGSPAPLTPAFFEVYRHVADLGLHLRGWEPGRILSLAAYAPQFAVWLFENWNPVPTMAGWANAAVLFTPALVLLTAVPAFAINFPLRRAADAVIGAGGIALAAIIPTHLLFSYRLYQITGSPPMDAVPRYYFPIALAVVPVAVSWTLARLNPVARVPLVWLMLLGLFATLPIISACDAGSCQ